MRIVTQKDGEMNNIKDDLLGYLGLAILAVWISWLHWG